MSEKFENLVSLAAELDLARFASIAVSLIVGICLGRLLRRKPESQVPAPIESSDTDDESEMSLSAAYEKKLATAEGNLSAAATLQAEQSNELERMDACLTTLRHELANRDKVLNNLVSGTAEAPDKTTLLAEAFNQESYRCNIQSVELGRLRGKIESQNELILHETEQLKEVRDRVDKGGKAPSTVKVLDQIDRDLRALHQNAAGAAEQLGETRGKLETRSRTLAMARDCASLENGRGDETFHSIRETLNELDPEIHQLLSETLGRVEFALKDSLGAFTKSLAKLSSNDPSNTETEDLGVSLLVSQACRRLTAIRGNFEGTELALANSQREFGADSKLRSNSEWTDLLEAVCHQETINAKQETTDEETVESQLDAQSELVTTLENDLIAAREEIVQLQSELDTQKQAPSHLAPEESNPRGISLLRRMLNLSDGGDLEANESYKPAVALSGIGGATSPPQSIFEARKALHSLKLAGTNDSAVAAPPEPQGEGASLENFNAFPTPIENDHSNGVAGLMETIESQRLRIEELEAGGTAPVNVKEAEDEIRDEPAAPAEPSNIPFNFDDTTHPIDGALIFPGEPEITIFHGDDPHFWNSESQDEQGNFSKLLTSEVIPENTQYLRLSRSDNGESVVLPISQEEILAGESQLTPSCGWSGRGEFYFGSHHLGIFDDNIPRSLETKFGAGGWGFGHSHHIGVDQRVGWAGELLEDPIKIEISIGTLALTSSGESQTTTSEPTKVFQPGHQILYRANDPTLWNTTHYSAANRRSLSIEDIDPDADWSWLRIRRLDTGESVIVPISRDDLTDDGTAQSNTLGFNGSAEKFYGAIHLGVYDESLPLEVETRFSYGGWGYGHDHTLAEEQSLGWGGEKIAGDTVIEITIYTERPSVTDKDRVLGE